MVVQYTSTYKCNCSFFIQVVCEKKQNDTFVLRIIAMDDNHLNHDPTEIAYKSLPRQRRATLNNAYDLIVTTANPNANARLVQNQRNRNLNGGSKVTLKDIKNRQAKKRR